jgi:hypothetical protein
MHACYDLCQRLCPDQLLVNPPWSPMPFLILSRQEGAGYIMKEEMFYQMFTITAVAVYHVRVACKV